MSRHNKSNRRRHGLASGTYRHGDRVGRVPRLNFGRLQQEIHGGRTTSDTTSDVGKVILQPIVEAKELAVPEELLSPPSKPKPEVVEELRDIHRQRTRRRIAPQVPFPRSKSFGVGRLLFGTEALDASSEVLTRFGLTMDTTREPAAVKYIRTQALEKYGKPLTADAALDLYKRSAAYQPAVSEVPQTVMLGRFSVSRMWVYRKAYLNPNMMSDEALPLLDFFTNMADLRGRTLSHVVLMQLGRLELPEGDDHAAMWEKVEALHDWQHNTIPQDMAECGPLEVLRNPQK